MEQLKLLLSKKTLNLLLISLSLTACAIAAKYISKKPVAADEEPQITPDTFIPPGYVLVPIMVSNFDSLNGLVDQMAVVNLYTANDEFNQKPELIADSVKLIRSSVDANHFAVLVKNDDSYAIVKRDGEFFVTIQNPNHAKEIKVHKSKKIKVRYLD